MRPPLLTSLLTSLSLSHDLPLSLLISSLLISLCVLTPPLLRPLQVTGEPLELKDLIRLNFHKNADGEYACPVLHKARALGTLCVLPPGLLLPLPPAAGGAVVGRSGRDVGW